MSAQVEAGNTPKDTGTQDGKNKTALRGDGVPQHTPVADFLDAVETPEGRERALGAAIRAAVGRQLSQILIRDEEVVVCGRRFLLLEARPHCQALVGCGGEGDDEGWIAARRSVTLQREFWGGLQQLHLPTASLSVARGAARILYLAVMASWSASTTLFRSSCDNLGNAVTGSCEKGCRT